MMKHEFLKLFKCRYGTFDTGKHLERVSKYYIEMPKLVSGYDDRVIVKFLQRILPIKYFANINDDCRQFALNLESKWFHLHRDCENSQPYVQRYDAWGKKIDEIVTCEAWKTLKQISCTEGLIAIGYDNASAQYSRVHQYMKLLLFAPLSGLYSCPLAMTDGAAYVIERLGRPQTTAHAYNHLVSRDPHSFWTSGQWMTEKRGGSDVGEATDTVAVPDTTNGCHRLYGSKWFSSATDANMTFTLARSLDGDGVPINGSKGLSLYYLETKLKDNEWNYLSVVNMKDKLGTRQLPTAELLLNGSKAIQMSAEGRGVASIAGMLTITRLHNAISAVGAMRRVTMLAVNYARKRVAFGSSLIDKPLHASTLAHMDIESRAAFYFAMDVVQLLGLQENKMADEEEAAMVRILSPLLKLYTAKQAMSVVSEGLECFGGQGFIESTGLPVMLRDAQVLPIWEGTTNVLSLDTLRSLGIGSKGNDHKAGYFHFFVSRCRNKMNSNKKELFPEIRQNLSAALHTVQSFIECHSHDAATLALHSRSLSYSMSTIYMAVLLLEAACANDADAADELSLLHWMKKDLVFGLQKNGVDQGNVDWTAFFD